MPGVLSPSYPKWEQVGAWKERESRNWKGESYETQNYRWYEMFY